MSDERSEDLEVELEDDFEVELEDDEVVDVDFEEELEVELEDDDELVDTTPVMEEIDLDEDIELDLDDEEDFALIESFPNSYNGLSNAPGLIPVVEDIDLDLEDDLDAVEDDASLVFKSLVPPPSDSRKYVELVVKSGQDFIATRTYITGLISSSGSIDDVSVYDNLMFDLNQSLRDVKPLFIDGSKVSAISKFVDEGMNNYQDFYRDNLSKDGVTIDSIRFTEFCNYCDRVRDIKADYQKKRVHVSNKQQDLRKNQVNRYLFNDLIDQALVNVDSTNCVKSLISSVVLGDNHGTATCNECNEEFGYDGVLFVIIKDGGNTQVLTSPRICPNCKAVCFLPDNVINKISRHFRKRVLSINSGSKDTPMLNIPVYHPSITELCELLPTFFEREVIEERVINIEVNIDDYKKSYLEMYERAYVSHKGKNLNGPAVIAKLLANNYGNYSYLKECAVHTFLDTCNKLNFGIGEYPTIMYKMFDLYKDYMTPERVEIFNKEYRFYSDDTIETVLGRYKETVEDRTSSIYKFKGYSKILGMIGIDEMIKVDAETLWMYSQNKELVELTDIVTDYMIINHFAEEFMCNYEPRKYNEGKRRFMKDMSYSFVNKKIHDLNSALFNEDLAKFYAYFLNKGVHVTNSLASGSENGQLYSSLIKYFTKLYQRDLVDFVDELPSDFLGNSELLHFSGSSANEIDEYFKKNREYFLSCSCASKFKVPSSYLDYALGRDVLFSIAHDGDLNSISRLFSMKESVIKLVVSGEDYKQSYPKIPYNKVLISNFLDDFGDMNSIDFNSDEPNSFMSKIKKLDSVSLMTFFKDCPKIAEVIMKLDE